MSFADGGPLTYDVHLDVVNDHLKWNPHPPDREARQEVTWDTTSLSPSPPPSRASLLQSARIQAGQLARRLAMYERGREILQTESPGIHSLNAQFWFTRAAFYETELKAFDFDEQARLSRSVTPEIYHCELFGGSELEQASGYARNAMARLATLPGGKVFTETERPGEHANDPQYWWKKRDFYDEKINLIGRETALDRAKKIVNAATQRLATFPAGKAFLDSSPEESHSTDLSYWRVKAESYAAEESRLVEEFWDSWRRRHFDVGQDCDHANGHVTSSQAKSGSQAALGQRTVECLDPSRTTNAWAQGSPSERPHSTARRTTRAFRKRFARARQDDRARVSTHHRLSRSYRIEGQRLRIPRLAEEKDGPVSSRLRSRGPIYNLRSLR